MSEISKKTRLMTEFIGSRNDCKYEIKGIGKYRRQFGRVMQFLDWMRG